MLFECQMQVFFGCQIQSQAVHSTMLAGRGRARVVDPGAASSSSRVALRKIAASRCGIK